MPNDARGLSSDLATAHRCTDFRYRPGDDGRVHGWQCGARGPGGGRLPDGRPKLTSGSPTGLSPAAVSSVYKLSGLSPSSGAGAGQIIAIVDAFHDPNALSDLNTFNAQYGYPTLATCTSLTQSGPCFEQVDPQGTPKVNSGWVLEESLDIEWAHAEAPAAKIVLVEAATNSNANLFNAVLSANSLGATEVSMSWGGGESSGETSMDSDFHERDNLVRLRRRRLSRRADPGLPDQLRRPGVRRIDDLVAHWRQARHP